MMALPCLTRSPRLVNSGSLNPIIWHTTVEGGRAEIEVSRYHQRLSYQVSRMFLPSLYIM